MFEKFEKQKNFENREALKDYTSRIELIFRRHDEEEKELGEPTIHVSYKKEKEGEKLFEYDEDIDKDTLSEIIEVDKM